MCADSPQSEVFIPTWLLVICLFLSSYSGLSRAQSAQQANDVISSDAAFNGLLVYSAHPRQLSLGTLSSGTFSPGKMLSILEDPTGQLQIHDLLAADASFKWQASTSDVPNFGYSESTFWFALQLKNESSESIRRIIDVGYPLLDQLQVFLSHYHNGKVQLIGDSVVLGDSLPFANRIINHRNFLIPVDIPPFVTVNIYFRVEGKSSLQFPLKLWDERALFEAEQFILIYFGFCFGGLLIMLIYNLFLFFSLGDKSYLYFAFALFFFLLVHASLRGLSYQFLWSNLPSIQAMIVPFSVSWGMASLAALSINLLNLKRHEIFLYRAISGVMCLLLLSGVLVLFLDNKTSTQLAIVLSFIYGALGLIAGVRSWLRGFTPAFLYTLAYLLMFSGTFILGSNKFGLLPRNLITEHVQEFGFLIESMILAAALANKISVLGRAKETAEKVTKASLKKKVLARTKELNDALNQLELSNYKLSKMSREDGLTHLFNRRAFDEFLESEWQRSRRSKSSLALILGDIDHFKLINDQHGHLAGDDCLRQISIAMQANLHRPGDKLFRFGGEEFAILLPDTDLEGAAPVAERMRANLASQRFKLDDHELAISMSFGVAAAVPTVTLSSQDLIFGADQALYRAKDNGRNRVELTNSIEQHSL